MAIEKILLLTRDVKLGKKWTELLTRFGVEVVDHIADSGRVPLRPLRHKYNVIVIDKWYRGEAQRTAAFVRELRQWFPYPLIGVDVAAGSGEILSLQVAGCNFIIPDTRTMYRDQGEREKVIEQQLCRTVSDVVSELYMQGEIELPTEMSST